MDSRDEELTLENVDEQIERCLAPSQELQPATVTSLARTVHNLQSVYEEERRLEDVWARINSRVSAEGAQGPTFLAMQGGKKALQDSRGRGSNSTLGRSAKQSRLPFRRPWYTVAIGLAAALILIVFFAWPMVSYALRGSWLVGPQPATNKPTPQIQATVNGSKQTGPKTTPTTRTTGTPKAVATTSPTAIPSSTANVLPSIKVYSGQYFTIQYPGDWVITGVTTGSGYVQTVQFRPSATSSVFVNVSVMSQSSLTSELLLLADADLKQGTLQSTSSVTYHGIAWTVGIVALSLHSPTSKLEIAYANQGKPYRIEFGAPSDMFGTYAPTFNAMFASFYPVS